MPPHIAEIGEYFQNAESFDFLSDQNLQEYDLIILDTDWLAHELNGQLLKRIEKRFNDLKEFSKAKNIPIVILWSNSIDSYLPTGKNDAVKLSKLLGIDFIGHPEVGKKIEVKQDTILSDFITRNINSFDYQIAFTQHAGKSIGNPKSKKNSSIGFYTPDFIFLPSINEEGLDNHEEFLEQLYRLCQSVRKNETEIILPDWSSSYLLPGEQSDLEKMKEIETAIANLESEKSKQEDKLKEYFYLKQLWVGSGSTLENVVRKVFEEIGFSILQPSSNRDDIIMKWNDRVIIAEIKGLNKSAAEKNSAQLEKWVVTYFSEHGIQPKGFLVVNTFRDSPLTERKFDSFPNQMLDFATRREHCMFTTLQLCCLLIYIRRNPENREAAIIKLITTVGIFEDFQDWSNYIN